jgi:exonuclease SbcC
VCVAHAFVHGGSESESERPLTVGGTGLVDHTVFDGFDYVALGHLHRPQSVGRAAVRYCGSLLKYSFSELDHAKAVELVELGADGSAQVTALPITPRRDLVRIEGTLDALLSQPVAAARSAYVQVQLTDEGALLDPLAKLRVVYPHIMDLRRTFLSQSANPALPQRDAIRRGRVELFASFYREVGAGTLDDAAARHPHRGVRRGAARGGAGVRPLCLEMTAFGPFAGTQVIDFRELGAAQLFLICGETGSGKSAILDGLCAALYGESSGGERTVQQLRSDHADPKVATTLRLDFRVGEHTYRIERTPAQQRAKLRGEGYVEQAASATLWRLASDAPGALVAEVLAERKVREVDARVLGLVKLEAAQFRRVVVLPQGDFRQLLSADSQAREKLLEKLFDTVAFKRVEEALALRAKKLGSVIRDAEQRRAGLLASQGETSVDVLVAKVEGHERALPHLTREAQEAGQRAQEAVTHLADGRQLAQRFEALRSERAQEAELEAREPAVQQERVKLGQAKAAEAIAPAFDAARRAAEQLGVRAEAEARAQDALREVGARQEQAAEAAREAAAQHQLRAEREAERAAAEARAQAGRDWATRRKAREAAEVASTGAQEACAERERAHQAMTQDLDALGAQRVLVAEAAAQLARAEADLAVATGRLALHRHVAHLAAELDVLEGELTNAQQQQHEAAAALDDASAALRAIEAAMHAGHAAVLARALRDGEPCPVCGSAEHPAPAETLASTPTEADHAAAERSAVKAREAHAGAATRAAAAEAKRDAKRSELHAQREPLGTETLGQVEQSVTLASATLAEAKARVAHQDRARCAARSARSAPERRRRALEVCARSSTHGPLAHHEAAKREEASPSQRWAASPPTWTPRRRARPR